MADNERFPSPHVFSGLEPGTKYRFTSVYPAEGNKLESPESPVLEASTRFLVDNDRWDIGQGPIDGFELNRIPNWTHHNLVGTPDQNIRRKEIGPFGTEETVWVSGQSSTSVGPGSGGWEREYPIDPTKSYVSIIYFKLIKKLAGTYFYHGPGGLDVSTIEPDDTHAYRNPYYVVKHLENVPTNVWIVSIGVIKGIDIPISEGLQSNIYNLETKTPIPRVGGGGVSHENTTTWRYTDTNRNQEIFRTFRYHEPKGDHEIWFASPLVRELGDLTLEDILSGDRERVFYKKEKV